MQHFSEKDKPKFVSCEIVTLRLQAKLEAPPVSLTGNGPELGDGESSGKTTSGEVSAGFGCTFTLLDLYSESR